MRPRLFIAEQVLDALEADEIAAVIGHEFGHIAAWDNLKRLAMKLCGDILIVPFGRSLDSDWSEVSERAADEFAVGQGSRSTALNLASALIKIARNCRINQYRQCRPFLTWSRRTNRWHFVFAGCWLWPSRKVSQQTARGIS